MEALSCEQRVIDLFAEVLREVLCSPGPHDHITIVTHLHDGGRKPVRVDVTRERLVGQ